MTVQTQVHDDFKLFTGKLDDEGHIRALSAEVAKWVTSAKIAPKSIGIEYVESTATVILSVGYTKGEAYDVELISKKIGRLGNLDADELMRFERALSSAAQSAQNVICHELYVTAANDLYMVTMSHATK